MASAATPKLTTEETIANHIRLLMKEEKGFSYKRHFFDLDFGKGGYTASWIYYVYDKQGKFKYVIKAYRICEKYAEALESLMVFPKLLQQLPLTLSKLILPTDSHIVEDNEGFLQILTLPAAEGSSLNALIKYSVISEDAFKELLEAIAKVSTALFQLHSIYPIAGGTPTPSSIESENATINCFRAEITENPTLFPFTLEKFDCRFMTIFRKTQSEPLLIGYIHGDCSTTNIFYDKEKFLVEFIDTMTIINYIHPDGKPGGIVALDYASTRQSLRLFGFYYGLSEEKIALMDKVFAEHYPSTPPPSHVHFYTIYFWMSYLLIIRNIVIKYPAMKEPLRVLEKYCIDQVHLLLNDQAS